MSNFESLNPLEKRASGDALTEFDRKVYESLDKGGQHFGKDFKQYLVEYLALNQPLVPIGQIVGFLGFTARSARVDTEQSTTTGSFVDLATVGPELTGLAPGTYSVFWGASMANSTDAALMGISENGAGASAQNVARAGGVGQFISPSAFKLVTFTEDNNSITTKYRVSSSGTATFSQRWLVAIKAANN